MTTTVQTDDLAPERVHFFPRQLITAADLIQEQDYHRARLREHNRFLHGWGVVCGCDVAPSPTDERPWQVRLEPGYVLSPQGDAIRIRLPAVFDIASCMMQSADPCAYARPCPPITRAARDAATVYLAVRHLECHARPVRVAPVGCSCDDADCEHSRIREGHELCCLSALPATHGDTSYDGEALLAGSGIAPCPKCPDDPWVVLATVELPARRSDPIIAVDPMLGRRTLLSTAALDEMVRSVAAGAGAPGTYRALEHARILDTRTGIGAPQTRIGDGQTLDLQVTGAGGVADSGVSAVALNVMVVGPESPGYLAVHPTGTSRPDTSTHNYADQNVANLVLAKIGEGGRVSIFNAGAEIDLIADVQGWFRA